MIGERIVELRKEFGISQAKLAEQLGVKPAAVSQFEKGKTKPAIETLLNIADIFKVNLHWLLKNEGQKYINSTSEEIHFVDSPVSFNTEIDMMELPVVGEISAGQPLPCYQDAGESVKINANELSGNPDDFLCFRVNGESMQPEIMHGDKVLIRKSNDWDAAEGKVCAVRLDGEITLKKLAFNEDDKSIRLIPLNVEFEDIIIRPDEHSDIMLLGILVYLYRKIQ